VTATIAEQAAAADGGEQLIASPVERAALTG
jgi:hypothetical protein